MRLRFIMLSLVALVMSGAFAQGSLSIATGGTGGVYYPYGGGLAELVNKYIDGYDAVAEVTGASVENVGLVFRGDSDMALALADTVLAAYEGTGDFEGRQTDNLRALSSIYPNAVQIVTLADSGITSLADLSGKRVSVGAPGSGTELSAETILNANGITYDDIDERRLNFNETANALRDGQIDAGFWSVGPPTSSILDLGDDSRRHHHFINRRRDQRRAGGRARLRRLHAARWHVSRPRRGRNHHQHAERAHRQRRYGRGAGLPDDPSDVRPRGRTHRHSPSGEQHDSGV